MDLSARHVVPFPAALTACTVLTDLSRLGRSDGGFVGSDFSTACIDTRNDPNHCGACSGGVCQPKIIDTSSAAPEGLGIDAASLFWTTPTTGVVTRWALSGAGAPTVFALGQQTPTGVVVADATDVYFTTTKGLGRCPMAGSRTTGRS